jgi:hypothetical protein
MVPLRVSVNRTSSGQRNLPCAGTQVEGVANLSKEYRPDCRIYSVVRRFSSTVRSCGLRVCTDSSSLSLSTGMLGVDCVSPVGDVAQTVAESRKRVAGMAASSRRIKSADRASAQLALQHLF